MIKFEGWDTASHHSMNHMGNVPQSYNQLDGSEDLAGENLCWKGRTLAGDIIRAWTPRPVRAGAFVLPS